MKTRISVQERLKDLRVERGLNLEELAQETGISKSALGSYENDNLRNSDLRSNPCFTRVCGVVRCGEKRWNLLSSQRICNTFATKISKKYRTLFGDRHWRVSFLLCRFCIGSYAVLIF